MKAFSTLVLLLLTTVGFSQNQLVQNSYKNVDLGLGGSTLVLNSKGIFFFASYNCTDMYVASGKWAKSKNKLILVGFDSLASLPKVIIEKKKSKSDSIKIYAVDYLDNPYRGLSVDLYRENGSIYPGEETDSTGYLSFSKKDFVSFIIRFQTGDMINDIPMYDFSNDETELHIKISYPNQIYLDRPLHFEKLKNQIYTIKNDGLYKGKKKVLKLL